MSEWKLFAGDVPYVSTFEYHQHRPRAAHLEQADHRERLQRAAEFLAQAACEHGLPCTWSDLGCGDGGLLSQAQRYFTAAWGYDFHPASIAAWPERGVRASALDVFGAGKPAACLGDVVSMTEVLEHLADPHGTLAWARQWGSWLVCSSPRTETGDDHAEEHAWAWDTAGYHDMITEAGWKIVRHEDASRFQVVLAA